MGTFGCGVRHLRIFSLDPRIMFRRLRFFRLHGRSFDHGDRKTGVGETSRDNPSIAAVVAWSGEDCCATGKNRTVATDYLVRGGAPCPLHQLPR